MKAFASSKLNYDYYKIEEGLDIEERVYRTSHKRPEGDSSKTIPFFDHSIWAI